MNEMAHVLIEAEPLRVETIRINDCTELALTLSSRIQQERIHKQNSEPKSLKWLKRNKNILRFDLTIQRNEVWSDEQKGRLIESILLGYPVPPMYTLRSNDNQLWFLDGKQRGTSFITYLEDIWEISDNIPPVYGVDIRGKKFSELPEEFQELLEDQTIDIYQLERLTPEQRNQVFERLNSGTPLKAIELTRALLGAEMLEYVNDISNNPFLSEQVIFTDNQRHKFGDQELVLQAIGLITGQLDDVSSKSVRAYALELRDQGINDEDKKLIEDTFEYLNQAFANIDEKKRKKILKKNDIIGLVGIAYEFIEINLNAENFGELATEFLLKPSMEYKDTKANGSAKKKNVNDRIKILFDAIKSKLN